MSEERRAGAERPEDADRPTPLAGPARGRAPGSRRARFNPVGVWTCVAVLILACVAVGLGIVLDEMWLVGGGVAGVVLGVVAAWAFGIINDTR